ncbi:4-hydroxy-2-oxoglutarate aldolase, partial [Dysosmobacter welbionis]
PGEQSATGPIGRQHPQIGHPLRHIAGRQSQVGPQHHPPQAGHGVTLRLGCGQQFGQRGGSAGGVVQSIPNALPPLVQGSKVRRRHGPQPGQNGPVTVLPEHRGPAGGLFQLISAGHGRRQQGQGLLPFPLPQQRPEAGGRGVGVRRQGAVVGAALPPDGHRPEGGVLPQQGLAVLDAQNVVGRLQQGGVLLRQQAGQRPLPGSGKAHRSRQHLSEPVSEGRCQQRGG